MIPPEKALVAIRVRARRNTITLLEPASPLREAVLFGMASAHRFMGSGWDLGYAREHVSFTIPRASTVGRLVGMIPYVGSMLAEASKGLDTEAICPSPAALDTGESALGMWHHECGHVGALRVGGAWTCLAYGTIAEGRLDEPACYAADMVHRMKLGGQSPADAAAAVLDALSHYGLDDRTMATARVLVRQNADGLRAGADLGGMVADSLTMLQEIGWTP